MSAHFTGNPKPLGIIGLVIAIFSLLFSAIPCVGFYAVGPSIFAVIFCLFAFFYQKQNKQNTAVPLSGMIIAVVAIAIGIYQYISYSEVFEAEREMHKTFKQIDSVVKEAVVDTVLSTYEKEVIREIIRDHANDSLINPEKDSLQW